VTAFRRMCGAPPTDQPETPPQAVRLDGGDDTTTAADSTPAADDAGAPVVAPPPRRVLPRLAAAGLAAALLAEPSSPEPVAFRQGWPIKVTGA
jgi:hypothetical protein